MTPPLNVLGLPTVGASTNVPNPCCVNEAPVPLMTPVKVVVLLTVSVFEPLRVTGPVNVILLRIEIVAEALLVKTTGLANVTGTLAWQDAAGMMPSVPVPREPALPRLSVTTPPTVMELLLVIAPGMLTVPVPANTSEPVPLMTVPGAMVRDWVGEYVSVLVPFSVMVPPIVSGLALSEGGRAVGGE